MSGRKASWSDPEYWSEPAEQAFAKALRRGRRETRLDRFIGRRSALLSFDDMVSEPQKVPEGLESPETVPLKEIRGSVGKAELFTRSFYPRSEGIRQRWKSAYAMLRGLKGYEPVELYDVDGVFYVVDGHFRISVSRALGHETIEATVRRWR